MEEHPVTFQNCFNLFFNQKDKIEIYEEEELEKYYLLKETQTENNTNNEKKKTCNKLFSSEISNNPNLKKPKKKLFQINPSTSPKTKINNDFLKQKRIKFATTHNVLFLLCLES